MRVKLPAIFSAPAQAIASIENHMHRVIGGQVEKIDWDYFLWAEMVAFETIRTSSVQRLILIEDVFDTLIPAVEEVIRVH